MILELHHRFQSVDVVTVHYHNPEQNELPPETKKQNANCLYTEQW